MRRCFWVFPNRPQIDAGCLPCQGRAGHQCSVRQNLTSEHSRVATTKPATHSSQITARPMSQQTACQQIHTDSRARSPFTNTRPLNIVDDEKKQQDCAEPRAHDKRFAAVWIAVHTELLGYECVAVTVRLIPNHSTPTTAKEER